MGIINESLKEVAARYARLISKRAKQLKITSRDISAETGLTIPVVKSIRYVRRDLCLDEVRDMEDACVSVCEKRGIVW